MTPKQSEYARHRAAGLGQAQSAIKAGYAKPSAKVIASRMERMPEIQAAIAAARQSATPSSSEPIEFDSPEVYLLAVVQGRAAPDPVRVGAAKALLPFVAPKRRAPPASRTPRQMASSAELAAATDLNERFKNRVVELTAVRKGK